MSRWPPKPSVGGAEAFEVVAGAAIEPIMPRPEQRLAFDRERLGGVRLLNSGSKSGAIRHRVLVTVLSLGLHPTSLEYCLVRRRHSLF